MNKYANIFLWVLFFTLLAPSGAALASWNAVPGDSTYAWKTGLEDVLIAVLPSQKLKTATHSKLTERRLGEVTKVLSGTYAREGLDNLSSQIVVTKESINKIDNPTERKAAIAEYIRTLNEVNTQLEKEKESRAIAYLPPQQENTNNFDIRKIEQPDRNQVVTTTTTTTTTTNTTNTSNTQINRRTGLFPVQTTQPSQTTEPTYTYEPTATSQPTQPNQPTQTTSPIQTTQPAQQPTQPVTTTQPVQQQPTQPVTTQPVQTTQPAQQPSQPENNEPIEEEVVQEIDDTQNEINEIIRELEEAADQAEEEETREQQNNGRGQEQRNNENERGREESEERENRGNNSGRGNSERD